MKRNIPKGCAVVVEAKRTDHGDWMCILDKPIIPPQNARLQVIHIGYSNDCWWNTWRYPLSVNGCLVVFENEIVSYSIHVGDLIYQLPTDRYTYPATYRRWGEKLHDGEYSEAVRKILDKYKSHGETA